MASDFFSETGFFPPHKGWGQTGQGQQSILGETHDP